MGFAALPPQSTFTLSNTNTSRLKVMRDLHIRTLTLNDTVCMHTEITQVANVGVDASPAAAVVKGPWGACDASCGSGWQERSLVCAALPGYLSEAWQCTAAGLQSTTSLAACR